MTSPTPSHWTLESVSQVAGRSLTSRTQLWPQPWNTVVATRTDVTFRGMGAGSVGARRTWSGASHSQRTDVSRAAESPRESLHGAGRDSSPRAGNAGKTWAKRKGLSRRASSRSRQPVGPNGLPAGEGTPGQALGLGPLPACSLLNLRPHGHLLPLAWCCRVGEMWVRCHISGHWGPFSDLVCKAVRSQAWDLCMWPTGPTGQLG